MTCYSCSKPAVFETERPGKYGTKSWCAGCFAQKAAKYEMKVVPLRSAIVKRQKSPS